MEIIAPYSPVFLSDLVALWNVCFAGSHNFHPLSTRAFRSHVLFSPEFDPAGLLVSCVDGRVAGAVHVSRRHLSASGGAADSAEAIDAPQAVLAIVLTHPRLRRRGIARRLLERSLAGAAAVGARKAVIGGGSPFYDGLYGGYRQPGVPEDNTAMLALAARAGFQTGKVELLFESDLLVVPERPGDPAEPVRFMVQARGADTRITARLGATDVGRISFDRIDGVSDYRLREKCSVYDLWVHDRHRRKGIGTALFYLAMGRIRPMYKLCEFQTFEDDAHEASRHLALKCGFRVHSRWRHFTKELA